MSNFIQLMLVRHGNTFEASETPVQIGAKLDLPLTNTGREQAKKLGMYCINKKKPLTAIYSGALQRQKQTAEIIAEANGATDKIKGETGALTEINYGEWEGLASEVIETKWPLEYKAWTHEAKWPDAIFNGNLETQLSAIQDFISHLRLTYQPGQNIVAISSNGIIRFFLTLIPHLWQEIISTQKIEAYKVKTGNFCELAIYENEIKLLRWNAKPE